MANNYYLDPNTNDVVVTGQGTLRLTTTLAEEVSQRVSSRLQVWLGEWWLDTSEGIPFRESILIKNPDKNQVDAIFTDKIITTDGVERLLSYESTFDRGTRKYSATFTYLLASGETATQEITT